MEVRALSLALTCLHPIRRTWVWSVAATLKSSFLLMQTWEAGMMTQFIGLLSPTLRTSTEFLASNRNPAYSQFLWANGEMNQQIGAFFSLKWKKNQTFFKIKWELIWGCTWTACNKIFISWSHKQVQPKADNCLPL